MAKKKSRGGHKSFEKLRLIGMVHLQALPGSANSKLRLPQIIDLAVAEGQMLSRAGFHAVIVENFGDVPFAADEVPTETIAAMAIVVEHVVRAVGGLPVGVNVLRNDAVAALAVAAMSGASFIRVNVLSGTYATDQGIITGRSKEVLRRRAALDPTIKIAADVHVKHAQPISQPDIALAAEETAHRAGADALIVSGAGTGYATDLDAVRKVAAAVRDRPIWIGSGVTPETVHEYLEIADAVIVGTCLKEKGQTLGPLDSGRVKAFVRAAN